MPAKPERAEMIAIIVALNVLAAMLGWLGCQFTREDPIAQARREAAEIARLPGLPSDAPVIARPSLVPMDQARANNAAVPFVPGKVDPARAFLFAGAPTDLSRATECLALAAMAEAGPSDEGQRAVIQVVLNRVRHPAFARTVCGVVFEGSQRRTGCQFSFTCDGSLARRYADVSWLAARARAEAALGGRVYAPVGNATHYHTDWVFPYWSPKLEKLARVETHLFFRWPGHWGSAKALRMPYRGGEPDVWQQDAAALPSDAAIALPPLVLPSDTPKVSGGAVTMRDPTGRANFVVIEPATDAAGALEIARKLCKADTTCRVLGWNNRSDIPPAFPIPSTARATLQFSFSRDPAGTEIVLYNCTRFAGLPRERCIPRAR
jgi:spore germination cell wall hydrolase CwlJ-like protein